MSDKQLENVSFDFIRYANCWEDAEVLLKGLQPDASSKVMSIGSAGDNCFSLLSEGPKTVVAVDISKVQLYLIELKAAAIRQFKRTEFLEFAGFSNCNDRIGYYDQIKDKLNKNARKYWDSKIKTIQNGIIHFGKFEQYFQLFRNDYFPKVHSPEMIEELLRNKPGEEQAKWHDENWLTEEWIALYKEFFGEKMMGDKGRDPEFLKHVEDSVADTMLERASNHLRTKRAQSNYFLHYILRNKFDEDHLPHYVRKDIYEKVQVNVDKLFLFNGLTDECLNENSDFTHFNLSDIFEYMDIPTFRTVAKDLIDRSADNARFVFWNLMIPRSISREFPDEVELLKELSTQLKKQDNGYFYANFLIEQKK